jgi:hypothetical protein
MRVDIGQRVLDNQAAGMAGDQAALAAMKGLRQATLADQYVGAANVARAGGAKNQAQYLDLMSKGAAEVAKEAANDILNATSPADFNKGAFGKIDNGEDIAEVKNKDGTVSYNRVTKDGTVIAPINGGKPYKDFTEFKSELAMQVRGDPERFVGYLQKQADQQLERQKAADLKEYHAAQVKNGATSAAAAMKNANTSASLHKVEQETKQLALDTEKALGIDPDKRTPEQAALVKAFETKLVAKQNTPELQNAALGRLDGAVKDYLGLGKNSVTQLDPVELDRQKKVMLYSMEIGREAVAQNRRIDPAAVIKLAEDRYLRERAGAAAASTGVALPSAQAGGDFPRPWRNAK